MSRPPKSHDNTRVSALLVWFQSASELIEHHPRADDIFSGALALRTAGSTSTRSLSRKLIFRILQRCPAITVDAVAQTIGRDYSRQSYEGYAAAARVVSKALEGLLGGLPSEPRRLTLRQEQELIDAPYAEELAAILPACKVWQLQGLGSFPNLKEGDGRRAERYAFDFDQCHA